MSSSEIELLSVDSFRKERDKIDGKIQQLERTVRDHKLIMFDALEEQENKFLKEKAQIMKDLDSQKLAFRELALSEARQTLGKYYKSC